MYLCMYFLIVELMASVEMLGAMMGYPAGVMLNRLGPSCSFVIAAICGTASQLLAMSATYTARFYSNNIGLMVFYFFVTGEIHKILNV